MAEVIRGHSDATSDMDARAEAIALALMGAGSLSPEALAEAAVWDGTQGAVMGRAEILAAIEAVDPADKIRVEQVVTHGRAGSVSGRVTRGTETRLYCHVIRFTTPEAQRIAQLVSFEHPGGT